MLYKTRAAAAAFVALALSACSTTVSLTENKPSATEQVNITNVGQDIVEQELADQGENEVTTVQDVTQVDTKNQTQAETLLYGAMTKFELMSFVEAVRQAEMQNVFETTEPMTVFAPNNQAFEFARLGEEADISALLTGHIVPGAMDVAALKAAVQKNGAPVKMTSQAGTELTVYVLGDKVKVAGPGGVLATITQADMIQSNGVMHQISSVLKPK